jgi:hypothetical protein
MTASTNADGTSDMTLELVPARDRGYQELIWDYPSQRLWEKP